MWLEMIATIVDGLWRTRVLKEEDMNHILKYYVNRHMKNVILLCNIKSNHTSPEIREISWNVPRKIRNVVDTVKGRELPKQVLSEELLADAYRKYVIAPAIASEHPSKIESMAPLCEVPETLVILLFLSQQYLFLVI